MDAILLVGVALAAAALTFLADDASGAPASTEPHSRSLVCAGLRARTATAPPLRVSLPALRLETTGTPRPEGDGRRAGGGSRLIKSSHRAFEPDPHRRTGLGARVALSGFVPGQHKLFTQVAIPLRILREGYAPPSDESASKTAELPG